MTVKQKHLLAAASIAVMWLAVILVGVYGPDFRVQEINSMVEVPNVVVVAPCAAIGTIVVAWRGFRD
jgi:hypothetical protein